MRTAFQVPQNEQPSTDVLNTAESHPMNVRYLSIWSHSLQTNREDSHSIGLPPTATIDLLGHCLSNHFQVDSCFYQRIKGTPVGCPISGLIAEAVLQRLERMLFAVISPKSSKRYFEDKFVIIKEDILSTFHKLLSTALSGITFTMESTTENELPFVDERVHKPTPETFETSL